MSSKDNLYYKKYAKQLSKMVASNEFQKMLGPEVNNKIIKYSDLEGVKDLNDIMTEDKDYLIILIETQRNTGHWVCLSRFNDKDYQFFDSYGLPVDREFEYIPVHIQEILDEKFKVLSYLLNKVLLKGGRYCYNNIKFQRQAENINPCGRYVCSFLYMFMKYNYNMKMFQEFMKNQKKLTNLPYDCIICNLTKVLD